MEVLRSEIINQDTGIATDKDGNSLGIVEVNNTFYHNIMYRVLKLFFCAFYILISIF